MILVDAHVHIHPCFDLDSFLNAAAANFRRAAADICPEQPYRAVLCLTEGAGARAFDRLWQIADRHSGMDGWSIERTHERYSLIASHQKPDSLIVVAGRQIRCKEGLEVLALGTHRLFDDGVALDAAIEQVHAESAVAVLPWGFGKWTGRRGRVVRQLMERRTPEEIFLGDNSGRPAFWREPAEFNLARQRGFRILPGTDPLPFASEVSRPGSYGFAIAGQLSDACPARDMMDIFADPSVRIRPFGRLEGPLRFLRNQLAMQLVKRQTELP